MNVNAVKTAFLASRDQQVAWVRDWADRTSLEGLTALVLTFDQGEPKDLRALPDAILLLAARLALVGLGGIYAARIEQERTDI